MIRSLLASLFLLCVTTVSAGTYEEAISAAIDNKPEVMTTALKQGLDPNSVTPSGMGDPLLMLAIRHNSDKIVDLLLSHKNLKIDTPNQIHETPLMIAIYLKKNTIANKLLLKGANPNNPGYWSPLHYAASVGNLEMIKKLLAKGAEVNARTLRGITPLYMAARDADIETVKLLLSAGARKDFCTNEALAPADIAKQRRNTQEVIQALAYDHCR